MLVSRVRLKLDRPAASGALLATVAMAVLATAALRADTEPLVTITELMQAMVVPASNTIFNVARDAPGDPDAWTEVRNSAIVLAESGSLLLRGGRAQGSQVWEETSRALAAAGEAALKAARERDAEGVADAGNLLIDSCERCHEKHWIR